MCVGQLCFLFYYFLLYFLVSSKKKKNAVEGLLFQRIGEQMGTILH